MKLTEHHQRHNQAFWKRCRKEAFQWKALHINRAAVHGNGNPEPHRAFGNLPAARSSAGQVLYENTNGISSNQDEAHIVKQQMNSHFIKQLKPSCTKKDILRIQEKLAMYI